VLQGTELWAAILDRIAALSFCLQTDVSEDEFLEGCWSTLTLPIYSIPDGLV
jgi:hypothetical protein